MCQLYDGYVAPMDAALLGLEEVAPGIADSFASKTSAANTVLIVPGWLPIAVMCYFSIETLGHFRITFCDVCKNCTQMRC